MSTAQLHFFKIAYSERASEHWRSFFFFRLRRLMDNGNAVSSVDIVTEWEGGGIVRQLLFSVHTLLGMDILT